MTLIQPTTPDELDAARALLTEYADEMQIDLRFQSFEAERASLPGSYAPPAGRFLLARTPTQIAGCVALRPMSDGACEMKRLYVRPRLRGSGLGRQLASAIVTEARNIGYRIMRLDTLESLTAARGLYQSLGFREVAPYYDNPLAGVVYMELALDPP